MEIIVSCWVHRFILFFNGFTKFSLSSQSQTRGFIPSIAGSEGDDTPNSATDNEPELPSSNDDDEEPEPMSNGEDDQPLSMTNSEGNDDNSLPSRTSSDQGRTIDDDNSSDHQEPEFPESNDDAEVELMRNSDNEDEEPPSNDDNDEEAPNSPPSSGHGPNHSDDALNEEDLEDQDHDGFDGEYEDDEWWAQGPPFGHLGMFHNEVDEEENLEDLEWWDDEEEDVWIGGDEDDDDAAFWEDHDDDDDDDDGFNDGFDDDISEASTLEPQEEADACDLAARVTKDRYLLHPPNGYMLPSSTFHFQSADAVAVCADPFVLGASLVATMDSDGVLLFRLTAAGEMTHIGGPPQAMQFLGGFESPSLSAYTMEMSPSGRYLLAGGDEGSLEIFAVDSRAPQRPPVPRHVVDDMSEEQPFFYLPIIPPESDWVTGNRPDYVAREVHELLSAPETEEMGHAQGIVHHSYPRTKNDAVFLNVLGFRDAAFLTSQNAHIVNGPPPVERPIGAEIMKRSSLGWVPRDVFFAAAVGDQYRGLEHQFNEFADMLGGKEKFDWKVEEDEEEEENTDIQGEEQAHRKQRIARNQAQKGALVLGGSIVLGYNSEEEAQENTMNPDGMVNGVRFGLVGGKERVLAADQSGRVYIFEIPPDACPLCEAVESMMCNDLVQIKRPITGPSSSEKVKMMPVVVFAAWPNALGASLQRRARILHTATLGPFGVPLNLAAASPDGKWIALVGDQQKVIVLDQADNFKVTKELSFEPKRFDYDFLDPDNSEVGSQYCCWNASSSLLAVTSDALHAVFVFSIPSGQLVMRVEGFVRTVLPVMFAPWNDRVIIFGEETKMMHVRMVEPEGMGTVDFNAREDLAEPGHMSQLIRVPADPRRPKGGRRRITGMATTAQGDVLVSTKQGVMYRYLPANEWVPETMKDWPVRFRESAQTLLQCAARRGRGGGDDGLTALPAPVVQLILKLLAGKKTDWLDITPDPLVGAPHADQQQPEEPPVEEEHVVQPAGE